MMQMLIYRDYGDFFVVYSACSRKYLLIEDVYSEFFRMKYVDNIMLDDIADTVSTEYSVDKEIVQQDLQNFCNEMENALSYNKSISGEESSERSTIQQDIFDKMADLMVPFSATIEITDSCNVNCLHCYRGIPKSSYWTEKTFYDALSELKSLGTMNLTITGGEPFTHPLITHFLDITRQLGFVINIQSNLILLDDAILSALQNNIVSDVSVSLYSTNAAEHDAITQFAGSMHKTVANIRRLIANGIPVSINCPVMSANQNSMIDLCRFAKRVFITGHTAEKIKAAILNSKLYDTSPVPFEIIDDFTQAVLAAARAAEDGDIVLLSPACASFDHFKNFAERGNTFKKIVMELKDEDIGHQE